MVLLIGFALLALLGTVHFHGQRAIRALVNRSEGAAPSSPLVAFLSLAVLHLVEIGAFATGFRAASVTFWAGDSAQGSRPGRISSTCRSSPSRRWASPNSTSPATRASCWGWRRWAGSWC